MPRGGGRSSQCWEGAGWQTLPPPAGNVPGPGGGGSAHAVRLCRQPCLSPQLLPKTSTSPSLAFPFTVTTNSWTLVPRAVPGLGFSAPLSRLSPEGPSF